MSKVLISSLLAAVLMFAWGAVSWMALPFHQQSLLRFSDEIVVAQALQQNSAQSGLYLLPNPHYATSNTHPEISVKATADAMQRMKAGPVGLVALNKAGSDPQSASLFIWSFVTQWLVALLLACLARSLVGNYAKRVMKLTAISLAGGIGTLLPLWNWWGFSLGYVTLGLIDLAVAGALAALVIARLLPAPAD